MRRHFDAAPKTANYLVNFSAKYNYIYVETPKVACTTIKRSLQLAEVGGDESRICDNIHDRGKSPLLRVVDHPDRFGNLLHNSEATIFCFVRNPFARSLSCYLNKIASNVQERLRFSAKLGLDGNSVPTFLEFLDAVRRQPDEERNIHWSTQTYLLSPHRVRYSFIGRFEFFGAHFTRVCEAIGIAEYASLSPARHATHADERVREFFGPKEIEKIQEIYEPDFRNFGYGWSPGVI